MKSFSKFLQDSLLVELMRNDTPAENYKKQV